MKKSDILKISTLALTVFLSFPPILKYSDHAITRKKYSQELDLKDSILDDLVKAYNENEISKENDVNCAIGYFSQALRSGSISINGYYDYNADKVLYNYYGEHDYDCILGEAVCRSENELIAKLLNKCGFKAAMMMNKLHYTNSSHVGDHAYVVIFDNDKKYIYDFTNSCYWQFDKLNHVTPYEGGTTVTSNPLILLSAFGYLNFNYVELANLLTYESETDFKEIIDNYKLGKLAFGDDMDKVVNETADKKEKIKKIELNKN